MTLNGRAIVVGSGVIGTAAAYYLTRFGWSVTLIDQGRHGGGCSHANCGLVCPSHVLPLAEPGAIGRTLKALFRRGSPFYIKPRFDLKLWSWLLRFAGRCNHDDMLEAGRACHALLLSSRSLYDDLFENEAIACEWETRGLLFVYQTRSEWEGFAPTNQLLKDVFGESATRLDADALVEREPALKRGLAGGWYYSNDAHLRPDRLLQGWRSVVEELGVTIRERCQFTGFVRDRDRVRAVETSQGTLGSDAVVIATGAWTPLLNRQLGVRVPIQPGKGYSITMPRPRQCPMIPLIFAEHRVVATPMQSGYRLGSTMEFAGYDHSLNRKRLDLLRAGAEHYLHEPYCEPVQEEWYGWRPMTYDSKPIIGAVPRLSNVVLATGHSMLGISMAPSTGLLVAELLSGRQSHIDPAPFAVTRF